MNDSLLQYYRCPEHHVQLALAGSPSGKSGYFSFGEDTFCYGRCSGQTPAASPEGTLYDAGDDAVAKDGKVLLPFDLTEVATNLRQERYGNTNHTRNRALQSALVEAYYVMRPVLPVAVRKHLQSFRLQGWQNIALPHWPVDRSVDNVFERVLLLALRAQGVEKIPFVWFWPEGAPSCAMMTHDVETTPGRDFCSTLMDIDDRFGIKAAFQVVPEARYEVPSSYLTSITDRGFEVGVQDLNHDGRLYKNRQEFDRRVAKINAYGREWGAKGFRSGVLYRRQDWFDALDFSYDMSVPNVAHLDPQRGGCCTVMPYFVGKILELPVTATQDYSLFHILKDYSIELWKRQTELIMEKHGLMSFIIHPEYIMPQRERKTYEALLGHLASLREKFGVWIVTPYEINRWWRERAQIRIVEDGKNLRLEGAGKERARIAYASEQDGRLVYTVASSDRSSSMREGGSANSCVVSSP
jgi:hypothetical protein